jgi:hypothetical protein
MAFKIGHFIAPGVMSYSPHESYLYLSKGHKAMHKENP